MWTWEPYVPFSKEDNGVPLLLGSRTQTVCSQEEQEPEKSEHFRTPAILGQGT